VIDWFDDKTVAVVGNALSLFDKEYGRIIDEHDVVCRINKGVTAIPSVSHGKRLDYTVISRWNIINSLYIKGKTKGSNFVVCSRKGFNDLKEDIPEDIYYYPLELHANLKWKKLGLSKLQEPSTGLVFLDLLSQCKPKAVSIFGFDWKETPTFYDLDRTKEPHLYELEKEYCLTNFVKKYNFKHYS